MKTNRALLLTAAAAATIAAFGAAPESDAAKMESAMMNPGSALKGVEDAGAGEFKVLVYGNLRRRNRTDYRSKPARGMSGSRGQGKPRAAAYSSSSPLPCMRP